MDRCRVSPLTAGCALCSLGRPPRPSPSPEPTYTIMDEPWHIYFEELQARAEGLTEQRFTRKEDAADAAHDAYRTTADRLVEEFGYAEAEALALTKAFGQTVSAWIDGEEWDWAALQEKLEERQMEWEHSSI